MKRLNVDRSLLCAVVLWAAGLSAEQDAGHFGWLATVAGSELARNENEEAPPTTASGAALPPAMAPTLENLRNQYDAKERQSLDVAAALRKLEASEPLDKPRIEQLKSQLRQLVTEAFAARQQVQQVELAEFQQRLLRTQQLLERNSKMQDQIIDRRVEDLLNPALKWDSLRVEPGAVRPPINASNSAGEDARLPPAVSKKSSSPASDEPLVDTVSLRQLIKLAEGNRDRVRALVNSGQVPTYALTEAEQNLVASQLRLAEVTGNLEEAMNHADLLEKLGEQGMREAKSRHEAGVADGSELFRAEKFLVEAQAKQRAFAAQAVAAKERALSSNNSRRDDAPLIEPGPPVPRNESGSMPVSIPGVKSPSDYARSIGELRETINELDEKIPQYRDSPEKSEMLRRLNVAKLQYDTLTLEFRRLLELARYDFSVADNENSRATAEMERLNQLRKQGFVSSTEIDAQRGRIDQAALRVLQTKSLFELYSQTESRLFPKSNLALVPVPDNAGNNEDSGADQLWEKIGLKVAATTGIQGNYRGGLLLVAVRRGSPAAMGGLRAQDILVGLEKWETLTHQHLIFVLSSLDRKAGEPLPVRFTILRNGKMVQGGFSLPSP